MSHSKVLEVIRFKGAAPISLRSGSTALLIIDMQRFFVHPGYVFEQLLERIAPGVTAEYFERMSTAVVPNIQRLQGAFRAHKMPIFYTATGTGRADRSDLAGWMRNFDAAAEMLVGMSGPARNWRSCLAD